MNAALQALSNTPPLTKYFLNCGAAVLACQDPGKKPPTLSRSYWRLMQELWHRKRLGYVAPTGILYGIRNVSNSLYVELFLITKFIEMVRM